MSSLHSLMFGWEYPPLHTGGLGVACQGLVRGLQKNGVGITLVLPIPTDAEGVNVITPGEMVLNDIELRTVKSWLQPYDSADSYAERMRWLGKTVGGSTDPYGPDFELAVERYTAQSVELTKDVNADVIHCHDWMTFEAGARASKYHDKPMVVHVHATELDRTDFKPNTWISDIERKGMNRADKVIAVSNYTKGILTKHYGIDGNKIDVIYNAHDMEHKAITAQARKRHSPLVLFLGRMTVQKNPWLFLDVAKRIKDLRPDVRFVMAGDGPMLTELIDRTCKMGMSDSMIFTGKVSRKEVDNLYREASCFVMPSLSEPFGLVALEAISHGVPVVLSRQSGASEVIEHAFKVDFWDTEKMADCILTILREEPLARQLSSEAPRILQRLTWQKQAGLVHSLYQSLIHS
jgi:glycogen synthase